MMRCAKCDAEIEKKTLGVCPVCLLDAALPHDVPEEALDFHYDLIEQIGRGGMGVLYRAIQHGSSRQVAVKMLLTEQMATPGMMERFRAEAEAVASLDHPHILPIYEIGEFDGRPFYSMKFASEGTVRDRIEEYSQQPREAARLVVIIARAIHHAHERGILHRDLKPGNILLDGLDHIPYVSDFGIAKWLGRESRLTLSSTALGTPHYIAPEQAAGSSIKLTPAADVYSLGAILYELLTGQPPFVGDTPMETLRLSRETDPPSLRSLKQGVPRDLEVISLKCLAKEPAARYTSAAALAEDLERWLDGHTILGRPATSIERVLRWTRRNRTVATLAGTLIVAVLAMMIAWALFEREPPRANNSRPLDKSIAILPFSDESTAHDQEFLCDGLSEEVLDRLAKAVGLRVIGRTSSFAFKGKGSNLADIGRKLNVKTVLAGAVQRSGDRLRVIAQLLNVEDSSVRWSHTYERQVRDLPTIRDEITRAIVDELKITLAIPRTTEVSADPVAYSFYLQGLYYSNKSSEEDLRKALSLFQQALDHDPNFARAWTGVAKAWEWLADVYVKPLEAYPLVRAAATKALMLDDRDADAHCYLGETERVLNRNLAGEDAEVRRALEIDPNSSFAYFCLMLERSSQGFLDEGMAAAETAHTLDPLSPIVTSFASQVYAYAGRIDESLAYARRTRELDPNYIYADDALALAYCRQGNLDQAIALYENDQVKSRIPNAGLAVACARAGRLEEARDVLGKLLVYARDHYVAGDTIAQVYVALGDNEEAFRWLERAYDDHSAALYAIGFRDEFRPLHADPRFADVLRRIGVDPAKVLSLTKVGVGRPPHRD